MSYGDWTAAFRPKAIGSSNLANAIEELEQKPWFIFLSSSAGIIGARGQANYASGNTFQDALAHNLRGKGRHAVSIDLGPVLGAGMLADEDETLNILKASGFYGIRQQDFITVVEHAITGEVAPGSAMPAQVVLGVGTGGLIRQNQPVDPYWSRTALFSLLNKVDMPPADPDAPEAAGQASLRQLLADVEDEEEAAELIATGLAEVLARSMTMLPEEIDANKPPNAYGVDSLVAVSVRNWVFTALGVDVSVFEVLSDDTILQLSGEIASRGGFGQT